MTLPRLTDIEQRANRDPKDADLIALTAATRAVLEPHKPVDIEPSDTICHECSFQLPNGRYIVKIADWPCPTVQAITEHLDVNP